MKFLRAILTICLVCRVTDSAPRPIVYFIHLSVPDLVNILNAVKGSPVEVLGLPDNAHPLFNQMFPEMIKIVSLSMRRNQHPNVELGPGAFKTKIEQYPPDHLNKRLKYLLKKKEEYEKQRKDLNARR